jgi:2-iminobutanoate/2-iminopropanoate deaminase
MAFEVPRGDLLTLETEEAPKPLGHYTQGIRLGDMVFVSGQLPIRPDGANLNELPFEDQAKQALKNVVAIVEAAGGSRESIVKTTAYIVDIRNWPTLNRVYSDVLGDWRPARAIVPVPQLHYGFLIEIDAIGIVSEIRNPVNPVAAQSHRNRFCAGSHAQ